MKVELKTKDHTEYSNDTVTFEEDGEFIEIAHGYSNSFKVWKSDLKKVVSFLAGGDE